MCKCRVCISDDGVTSDDMTPQLPTAGLEIAVTQNDNAAASVPPPSQYDSSGMTELCLASDEVSTLSHSPVCLSPVFNVVY